MVSSLSIIKDADIAQESFAYIRAQILQQASVSRLASANQAPSLGEQCLILLKLFVYIFWV